MIKPKLSLLCATYNHERFVRSFIDSVLTQSVPDWELILVDDCSTDGNVKVIQELSDQRIHLLRHSRNEGTTKSLQDAFCCSLAPVVSWVASDDVLEHDYVETVLRTFDAHPDVSVVYSPLLFMCESGELTGQRTYLPIGKSRDELFAEMFVNENLLHSPGMALRREAFEAMLPLDIGLLQLADWQLHLRLLYRHQPYLLENPIVRYRVSGGSACSRGCATEFRERAERHFLMDAVSNTIGGDLTFFKRVFSTWSDYVPKDARDIPFLLGVIALKSRDTECKLWGARAVMAAFSTVDSAQRIYDHYGVAYSDYMRMIARASEIGIDGGSGVLAEVQRCKNRISKYKVLTLVLSAFVVFLSTILLVVL